MSVLHPWAGIRPWKRHSLALLVAGLMYVAIGFSYTTIEQTQSRSVIFQYALQWMSFQKWGIVFMIAGVLAIISARWPPVSETWGYTVLTGLSAGWAAFIAAGVIFGDSPFSNLSGVAPWGLIAFMWWVISGLVNPAEIPPPIPNSEE